jgi:8-oxo-dGTP pyrophosphatase MutT (NUDIX family)
VTYEKLQQELPQKLRDRPGLEGQLRMAPRPRIGWRAGHIPDDARTSGVLLLLYPVDGAAHLVLTVRNRALAHHGGQVSLPGGAVEEGETIERAAVRETHEEVGVDPGRVRLVGELTALHVPVSANVLHPRVGLIDERPDWKPDPREVFRVLEAPLARLADPRAIQVDLRERFERAVEVPYFDVAGERVWGATAMVLAEFLTAVGHPPDPWR